MNVCSMQFYRSLAALMASMLLVACSSYQVSSVPEETATAQPVNSQILPVSVSEVLSANSQDIAILVESGEFRNMLMNAGPAYYSASGRDCRKAYVSDDVQAVNKNYVVCQHSYSEWVYRPAIF